MQAGLPMEIALVTVGCSWVDDELHGLVEAAKVGAPGDVEALLQRFDGLIRSVAIQYRLTCGFEEAYQESCLAFLTAIDTYDVRIGPFPAYAAMKVRGDVRTAMRRLWRVADKVKGIDTFSDESTDDAIDRLQQDSVQRGFGGGCSDAWSLTWTSASEILQMVAMAELSSREMLWLRCFMAGYRQEEIARMGSVGCETVKTWRKRALAKLRAAARRMELEMRDFV